jgi:hypothetical protein
MNRHGCTDAQAAPAKRWFARRIRKIRLKLRHIRTTAPNRHPLAVYQALTIIGKDCDEIGQNSIRAADATKAGSGKIRHHIAQTRLGAHKTWRTQDAATGDPSWP